MGEAGKSKEKQEKEGIGRSWFPAGHLIPWFSDILTWRMEALSVAEVADLGPGIRGSDRGYSFARFVPL